MSGRATSRLFRLTEQLTPESTHSFPTHCDRADQIGTRTIGRYLVVERLGR